MNDIVRIGKVVVGVGVIASLPGEVEAWSGDPVGFDRELPFFDVDNSRVLLSPSGNFAIETGGKPVSSWMDGSIFRTADGGELRVIRHSRGGKTGDVPLGYVYEKDGIRTDVSQLTSSKGVLPAFDGQTEVQISWLGDIALIKDGERITSWEKDWILTENGKVNILRDANKGTKPGGAIGWKYESNDPDVKSLTGVFGR